MMTTPPSPLPSMNSSACPSKTNNPRPKLCGLPAVGSSTMSNNPSHTIISVRDIIDELCTCGYLSGMEIPDAELTEERTSALFDGVLEHFLAEVRTSAGLPLLPKTQMLGEDGPMKMLHLYLVVRSSGGYAAITSWAGIAEVVGLEPVADAPLRLLYFKYLLPLEQIIGNCKPERQEQEVVGSSREGARRSNAKKDHARVRSTHLKRKREVPMQMLNWVHLLAKSSLEHGNGIHNKISSMLKLRRLRFANIDCSELTYNTTSEQSGLTNEGQTNGWDDRLCAGGNSDMILHARTRLSGLADVPDWIGKPSLRYDEPHALRFLGQPLYPAQSNGNLLDAYTIGKGRPDNCNCQLPGSVVCVRFHVAEKRIKIKQELGSAFYAMGFDRISEDATLTWRKDEEKKFHTVIQNNLPSSKYRFMEEVFAAMGSKGRKDVVNYYHNVFQVRQRAYQNRLTPNHADSDDDSLEPGFLHLRQGGGQGNSMSASSSGTQRGS